MDSDILLSTLDSTQFQGIDISTPPGPSSSISQASSLRPGNRSAPKKRRGRTSWIWEHIPNDNINTIYVDSEGNIVWKCKYCLAVYAETTGTGICERHLGRLHQITKISSQAQKQIARESTIDAAFARAAKTSYKRRCLTSLELDTIDPAVLEQLYVRFLTACNIPFHLVQREEFRTLIRYINKDADTWLPSSHSTVRKWTIRTFQHEKNHIKQLLQSALSKVHLTVDLWTSPNSLAFIGIIGHYIAENGDLRHSVLALKEVDGDHSGANQALHIMEVLRDYGIASKLGYFMMDNAESNDTMLVALANCKYILTTFT